MGCQPHNNFIHISRKLIFSSNADSLMYITAAGQGILVLNSHKAVGDLLDRRGQIYGDRPRLISKY